MNLCFHLVKVGLTWLKILSFRTNQIPLQASTSTSMKNGLPKLLRAAKMLTPLPRFCIHSFLWTILKQIWTLLLLFSGVFRRQETMIFLAGKKIKLHQVAMHAKALLQDLEVTPLLPNTVNALMVINTARGARRNQAKRLVQISILQVQNCTLMRHGSPDQNKQRRRLVSASTMLSLIKIRTRTSSVRLLLQPSRCPCKQ
jgi:hypothetical protein